MASAAKRLSSNADGDLFVDDSCIDCGTCRWMAPESFNQDETGEYSRVHRQPGNEHERRRALQALVSCPVSAIGTRSRVKLTTVVESFPKRVFDNVYHCGFHSEKSFGAASYLVVRPEGNVLVDSPRFTRPLVRRIEALGGVRTMFLTHRDDVADHQAFAEHFGCARILHRRDVTHGTRAVERQLEGDEPIVEGDLVFVPTPGHTRGST
jgi:ferredoxin